MRGVHRDPFLDRCAHVGQHGLQGLEAVHDVFHVGPVTHETDAHDPAGERAKSRADAINMMLEDFGLEPERYQLEWVAASEGPRFAEVMTKMVEQVKKVGPNPFK